MENSDIILVIDDSNTALLLLEYALNEGGYKTHTVSNVKDAITFLGHTTPRMVLLDLSMPEISGYDFLNMKSELHLDKVPIIVTSAYDSNESVKTAKDLGAVDFVAKPIPINVLMEKISENLK